MRHALSHILPLLILALSLLACDKTPRGVLSTNKMADLITDLQLAESYIESHSDEFPSDSSRMVIKQSIFKKYGITQQDYDSSLVWYAHNMEDYIKAYDKAVGKLKKQYDKLDRSPGVSEAGTLALDGEPTHNPVPNNRAITPKSVKAAKQLKKRARGDSIDLWKGPREYILTQGARRGFITFDLFPDADKKQGDRYQLAYKLTRGGNDFKVSLNVDYTDGATAQMARSTNSDGWVTIDVQSDTARHVRRIYGYVSYDIKRGHTAYVDSLMLMRTHLSKSNYGFINAQRLFERNKPNP